MAKYKETITGEHKKGLLGGMFSGGLKMGLFGAALVALTGGLALIPMAAAAVVGAGIGATYTAARWGKESLFNLTLGRPRLNGNKVDGGYDQDGERGRGGQGLVAGLGAILSAAAIGKFQDWFDGRRAGKEDKINDRQQTQAERQAEQARLANISLSDISPLELNPKDLESQKGTKDKLDDFSRDVRRAYSNDLAAAARGDNEAQTRIDAFNKRQDQIKADGAGVEQDGAGLRIPAALVLTDELMKGINGVERQIGNLARQHERNIGDVSRTADRAEGDYARTDKNFDKGRAGKDALDTAADKLSTAQAAKTSVEQGDDVKAAIGSLSGILAPAVTAPAVVPAVTPPSPAPAAPAATTASAPAPAPAPTTSSAALVSALTGGASVAPPAAAPKAKGAAQQQADAAVPGLVGGEHRGSANSTPATPVPTGGTRAQTTNHGARIG